jgi:hypothetical protein
VNSTDSDLTPLDRVHAWIAIDMAEAAEMLLAVGPEGTLEVHDPEFLVGPGALAFWRFLNNALGDIRALVEQHGPAVIELVRKWGSPAGWGVLSDTRDSASYRWHFIAARGGKLTFACRTGMLPATVRRYHSPANDGRPICGDCRRVLAERLIARDADYARADVRTGPVTDN